MAKCGGFCKSFLSHIFASQNGQKTLQKSTALFVRYLLDFLLLTPFVLAFAVFFLALLVGLTG